MNKASEEVKQWNETHAVGVAVMRYKLINPLREGMETVTTSEAWVLSGHSAVVKVRGVSGCVLLQSLKPIATK